jgi:hypothetical protein
MAPITRVIDTGGYGPVEESFTVPAGEARLFTVRAVDGNVAIWNGSALADIGGTPAHVPVLMEFMLAGDGEAPTVPSDLSVSLAATNTIGLTWSASIDNSLVVAGYYIYELMDNSPAPYLLLLDSVSGTSAEIQVAGDGHYCYRVSAIDPAGNESGLSPEQCITVGTEPYVDRTPRCPEFLTFYEHPGNYKWNPDSHMSECYGDVPPPRTWWRKVP